MNKIDSILYQLLQKHKYLTSSLSLKSGVSLPVIYRILMGEVVDLKLSTLLNLAGVFNITVSQLIGETPLAT